MAEALFRVETDAGVRLDRGSADEGPSELLSPKLRLDDLLAGGHLTLAEARPSPPAR